MISVYATKRFAFRNGAESAQTSPMGFGSLPEWVIHDPLFQWAKADGDIKVIETQEEKRKLEKNPAKPKHNASEATSKKNGDGE